MSCGGLGCGAPMYDDIEYEIGDRVIFEAAWPELGIPLGASGTVTAIECDQHGDQGALVIEMDEPLPKGKWLTLAVSEIVEAKEKVRH